MSTTLDNTAFTFGDGTSQTTKFDSAMDNGYLIDIQTFTGNSTWYKPAGCEKVLVKVVGGGGGACGYCESGGAGGYAEKVIMVQDVSAVTVTIGGGGGATGYYSGSGNGGTSSFGSYVSASGGYGANQNYGHTGGHGGVGYKGDLNLHGGDGTGHANNGGHAPIGQGGASYFGGSACVRRDTTSTKLYYGAPGAGAPGGRTNDGGGNQSSNGESGMVVVYSYAGAAGKLGSTSALAASSAAAIKAAHPESADGVYWINLPTVGATQVFCLMDTMWDGGGWMMMMKATRANTFSWGSAYWTAVNTLNPANQNRDDGDMKNNVMNYFAAKDILGIWPDLGNGGMISGQYQGTIWQENNFYGGNRIIPINFFNGTVANYNPNGRAVRNVMWNGGSQFSSQSGAQWYGFNFTANGSNQVRWGFAWNNEGDWGSNDVSGGIGMNRTGYSAGDYIGCCQDVSGFNRSARIELYVR